ncbi:MAG: hypothetical protein PUF80_03390 [Firmicutes bacterium]|nr:hypothetical protein [Bacillota bacterium]
MSASRERKKRQDSNVSASVPQKKAKKKLSEGWILAISIVLIVALVFGGIFGFRAYQRSRTVLTVGTHEVKVPEFNFFYNSTVSSFTNYASYLGIDTSTTLDKQNVTSNAMTYLSIFGVDTSYLSDYQANDEGVYEDVTWAQLFASATKDTIVDTYAVYNEAVAAGYTLDAEDLAEIDSEIAEIEGIATSQGEKPDELYARVFGNGCDEEGYRNYMVVVHTASHYPDSLSYTDAEIAARYEQSPEDFDVVSFYLYSAKASDYAETNEDGTTAEPTEENKAAAKADAEEMAKEFKIDDEKVTVCADYTKASVTSSYGEEAAAWIFDTASVNGENVKLFEKDDVYYVLKLAAKGDYTSYHAVELYVAADSEELEEGETTAAEKIAAIEASLEEDGSEENFRALVQEYVGEDSDGTVENLMRNSMAGVSKEMFNWGLEERKAGDFASFETSSGTIFLYITGSGKTHQAVSVSNKITNEWYNSITETANANCGYDEDAAMGGNVDLILKTN